MTRRDNQVKTYLTDKENAKLERWAEKVAKSKSELLRDAVLEYTDRDRVERVEHEVREVNDKIDRVLSLIDGEHTHTRGSDSTQSVPEKARAIARRLYRNHDVPIQTTDVEFAIEDIAGADDRTVEKYKQQLKKRGLLYAHPTSGVWTDDKEQWVEWTEAAYHNVDVHEVTQEYGMSTTEYTQLAEATHE